MHKEDLPTTIDLAHDSFANQVFIVFTNGGANRQALLRWCFDDAHIAQVDQRHMQCAWDRGRGHGQDIDLAAHLFEALFMDNAKALLFVNDQQAEVEEDDIFLQQAMGADDDIDFAKGQILQYLLLLFL